MLFFLFLSASPILDVEGNPNSSGHVLVIDIETDSDWSTIKLESNSSILFLESSIVTGEKIQEIENYHDDNDFLLIIKKKPYDTTPVAIKYKTIIQGKNPEINISIYKGFIGFTNLTINAYQDAGFHTIKSINHDNVLSMPDINPLFTSLILQTPNDYSINLNTNPPEISKTVFACYYPWYESPNEINNRWKHWAPVSEQDIAFSPHFPMIGLYDSRDTSIYKAHINMGVEAGLDGFLCSWSGVNTTEDYVIEKMVQIATEYDFQIGIYYESFRGKMEPLKHDQIVEELSILINKYRGKPGYLHFLDLPVIFIYQAETANRTSSFWNNIFEEVRLKTGDAVFIGEFRQEQYFEEFDGVHLYNELDINIHEILMEKYSKKEMKLISDSWQSIEKELIEKNSLEIERLISVGTVVPGYDDREIRSPGQVLPRNELSTYRAYWDNVNENDLDWVIITSFNEWHEGTEIEPSLEYGFDYLVETKKQIAKFKEQSYIEPKEPSIKLDLTTYDSEIQTVIENDGNANAYSIQILMDGVNEFSVPFIGKNSTFYTNFSIPKIIYNVEYNLTVKYSDFSGGTKQVSKTFSYTEPKTIEKDIVEIEAPKTTNALNIIFNHFKLEPTDNQVTVTASAYLVAEPKNIEYCSLNIIIDEELVYGECWSNIIENSNSGVSSPAIIGYTKKIELPPGVHDVKLRVYARNKILDDFKETAVKQIKIEKLFLILDIPEIFVYEVGDQIVVEATANIESYPIEIEYASLDILLNDQIIHGECWTSLDLRTSHYNGVISPATISYSFGFQKPENSFDIKIKSYARNKAHIGVLRTKKVYQSREETTQESEIPSPIDNQNDIQSPDYKKITLQITNDYRVYFGKKSLKLGSNQIAQEYAETMLKTKEFKHNPNLPIGIAENIAMIKGYSHYYSVEDAIERMIYLMIYEDAKYDWGHRDNILNSNYSFLSVGVAYNEEYIYLVQNFEK